MARDINEYAKDYLSGDHDFERFQIKFRRKKVLEILQQYKPKNILEIGCGMDSIANYYTDYQHFVIVEPSKEFLQNAVKNTTNNKIIKLEGLLEDCVKDLADYDFDFIILSGLLHEVENPKELLQDAVKLCGKDTILHINVPNAKSFHLLLAYESGIICKLGELTQTAKTLQQNTTFDLKLLENLAIKTGLTIVESGSYFVKLFNHAKMAKCMQAEILDEKLLDGLYEMNKYMGDLGSEIFVNCRMK